MYLGGGELATNDSAEVVVELRDRRLPVSRTDVTDVMWGPVPVAERQPGDNNRSSAGTERHW